MPHIKRHARLHDGRSDRTAAERALACKILSPLLPGPWPGHAAHCCICGWLEARSEEPPRLTVCVLARYSLWSWKGVLANRVSFQRSGVRKLYDLESASNAALAK